jgi:hypothetical protein
MVQVPAVDMVVSQTAPAPSEASVVTALNDDSDYDMDGDDFGDYGVFGYGAVDDSYAETASDTTCISKERADVSEEKLELVIEAPVNNIDKGKGAALTCAYDYDDDGFDGYDDYQ